MSSYTITIVGGDLRQCYLADYLHDAGHTVTCCNTMPFPYKGQIKNADSLATAISNAQLIIGPVPFSKDSINVALLANEKESALHNITADRLRTNFSIPLTQLTDLLRPDQRLAGGIVPNTVREACANRGIRVIDFMESESLSIFNAALTAEGLLVPLIKHTPFSLFGQPILLLGYGRCGNMIGAKLKSLGGIVSAYDTDADRLALAKTLGISPISIKELTHSLPDYALIVNTVPSTILTEKQLATLNKACLIFDIASAPGGFDKQMMDSMHLQFICCPGIPGKFMPKTAGELIGKTILQLL
ncbi:hypothetical protein LQZ18_06240 [Lachnospiraceae bacterium ZAX-1]